MKKVSQLSADDVRDILDDKLRQTGLDKVAGKIDMINDATHIIKENEQNLKDLGTIKNRLNLLDKIYVKIDKIAGEVTTYREQQELNSGKLTDHDDRIEKIEKHLRLPIAP